jgi:hypothetical protein
MIQDSADFHQTACQKAANSIRETEQLKNSCFHPKDIIKSSGIKLSEKIHHSFYYHTWDR